MLAKVAPYSKFVVALLGALAIGAGAVADAQVDQTETLAFVTALVTALGVFFKRNATPEA